MAASVPLCLAFLFLIIESEIMAMNPPASENDKSMDKPQALGFFFASMSTTLQASAVNQRAKADENLDQSGKIDATSVLLPGARQTSKFNACEADFVAAVNAEKMDNLNLMNQSSYSHKIHGSPVREMYAVYNWRWYILATVAALNCFNATSWISYAPVANRVDEFYGASTANYLTMVFLIAALPVGFLAIWSAGKFGIRLSILIASWCNCCGAVIRLVSCLDFVPFGGRRPMVLMGQTVAAVAFPFIMFLPTKTAAAWFPDNQRALANTLATLANPLGVLLAMLVAPGMVQQPGDVFYLNLFTAALSTLACIAATLGVRSSEPPTPPTRSATQVSMPFWAGLRKLVRSRSFWILLLALGSGIGGFRVYGNFLGMFNCLYGLMQQMLCARGYSNAFAGLCCVLMVVGGFAGAFTSAVVVDKTKQFEKVMKLAFVLALMAGVMFSICVLKPNLAVPIASSCFVFGFFGIAAYPIGLEMAVECSFPVAETMSSGFIVLGGQILGTAYMVGMQALRSPITGNETLIETCSSRVHFLVTANETASSTVRPIIGSTPVIAYDMTVAMVAFCLIGGTVIFGFVLLFKPKLRRLKMEQQPRVVVQGDDKIFAEAVEKLAPLSEEELDYDPTRQEEMVDLSFNAA